MFFLVTDSLNFEGLKMQKWNVPTDRVQIVDEKNGVFKKIFQLRLNVLPKLWLIFYCCQQNIRKRAMFYI